MRLTRIGKLWQQPGPGITTITKHACVDLPICHIIIEAEELHCLRQKGRPPVHTRRGVDKEESVVFCQEVQLNTLIDNGIDKSVWTSASLVW